MKRESFLASKEDFVAGKAWEKKKEGRPVVRDIPSCMKKRKAATYSPTKAVPSARAGLTSLFGMGRGGTPPP